MGFVLELSGLAGRSGIGHFSGPIYYLSLGSILFFWGGGHLGGHFLQKRKPKIEPAFEEASGGSLG